MGIQANEIELKILKLNRVKVIDRSYILEDYREKDRRFILYYILYLDKETSPQRQRQNNTSNQCEKYTTMTIIKKLFNCLITNFSQINRSTTTV